MEIGDKFIQASRLKLRFDTARGFATVEDLWDLPLTAPEHRPNLDAIAMDLYRQTRDAADVVSFVNSAAEDGSKAELWLKFDIVKHVIDVRKAERDEAKEAADRREKKQRLLELIARKEDEALGQKSVDELRELAQSL